MKLKETNKEKFDVCSGYSVAKRQKWNGENWYEEIDIYFEDKLICSVRTIHNKVIFDIIQRYKKEHKTKYYKVIE